MNARLNNQSKYFLNEINGDSIILPILKILWYLGWLRSSLFTINDPSGLHNGLFLILSFKEVSEFINSKSYLVSITSSLLFYILNVLFSWSTLISLTPVFEWISFELKYPFNVFSTV